MDAAALGQRLAECHEPAEADADRSLLNYAECARADDWSLRSALMRMAQPEPERVARVLSSVRRLDAVLHHVGRMLLKQSVVCDRDLDADLGISTPYPDARAADVARLVALVGEGDAVIEGYSSVAVLGPEERQAVPLLLVALEFDAVAETLANWAATRPGPPPVAEVDDVCERVEQALDALGVPIEDGPPRRGGRG